MIHNGVWGQIVVYTNISELLAFLISTNLFEFRTVQSSILSVENNAEVLPEQLNTELTAPTKERKWSSWMKV